MLIPCMGRAPALLHGAHRAGQRTARSSATEGTTYLLDPMAEVIDTPPLEILGGGLHVLLERRNVRVGTADGVASLG